MYITSGCAESSLRRWQFHTNRWSAYERSFTINKTSLGKVSFYRKKTMTINVSTWWLWQAPNRTLPLKSGLLFWVSCLTASSQCCWPRNPGVLSGSSFLMYFVNLVQTLLPNPPSLLHPYSHHLSSTWLQPNEVKSWPCPSHWSLHMLPAIL